MTEQRILYQIIKRWDGREAVLTEGQDQSALETLAMLMNHQALDGVRYEVVTVEVVTRPLKRVIG